MNALPIRFGSLGNFGGSGSAAASYTFPTTQQVTLAGTDRIAVNDGADKYALTSAIAAYLATATIPAGTLTTSQPLSLTQAWNAGGVTFTGFKVNVTNTASADASRLLDLQVAGTSKFNVDWAGRTSIAHTDFTATGDQNLLSLSWQQNVPTTGNVNGLKILMSGDSKVEALRAISATVAYAGTTAVDTVICINAVVGNNAGGTGTITNLIGYYLDHSITSTAAVTFASGYQAILGFATAATVTDYRGFEFITPQFGGSGGVITTQYAFYAGPVTGAATNYAFYSSAGRVRFGDQVTTTIGTMTLTLKDQGAEGLIRVTGAGANLNIDRPTGQSIYFTRNGTATIDWEINSSGHIIAPSDNARDFGSATNRPRDIYASRDIFRPGGTQAVWRTSAAITSGAGAGAGTLSNAPAAGNPTCWIPVNDNGTTRYIPAW